MNAYERTFRTIAEEIELVDLAIFRHPRLGTLTPPRDLEADPAQPVLLHLWRVLYLSYYAGDETAARLFIGGGRAVAALPDHEDFDFGERLHRANPGRGHVTGGWKVVEREKDAYLVTKDGITLRVTERNLVTPDRPAGSSADARPAHGDSVEVRLPAERRYAMLGWYLVIGDEGPVERADGRVVRVYFTLAAADHAPGLLRTVVGRLNHLRVPFQLKVANHPDAYQRRDSCVVYVGDGVWKRHRRVFEEINAAHAGDLRDDHPCFALRLGRGMSCAEEPDTAGGRMSFGEHRCLLVAEALVQAFRDGARTADERFAAIAARFREEGLDIRRPYLNAERRRER